MSGTLLIAQYDSECAPLAQFGQAVGKPFDFLVLSGSSPGGFGEGRILICECGDLPPADSLCDALTTVASEYEIVAGVSSMFGKDYLPRLAGLLDRPMVSEVTAVVADTVFERPMYAGNIIANVKVDAPSFVASIRTTAFQQPEPGAAGAIESFSLRAAGATERTGVSEAERGRPDLANADVVVSGGRPLKDAETFERLIGGLADALGGAAGATRAAVDSGIAPNELQVGQTGKVVAPKLYVAAGISGSTQHIAGMKDSATIVAINTDPDAPIFQIADYWLVQDLFTAIPEILSKTQK